MFCSCMNGEMPLCYSKIEKCTDGNHHKWSVSQDKMHCSKCNEIRDINFMG